ncbi:hypothetical protein B0O99DRAFT_618799 [Bisporella sp. PMI_857]|nr:hypothetical protein B0O99DRAFT_618799 [Bisporella sp. PMI_857]
MLRSSATTSLFKSLSRTPASRSSYSAASPKVRTVSIPQLSQYKRPQAKLLLPRLATTSLLYTTKTGPLFNKIDTKLEKKIGESALKPHPEEVSGESSVRHVFEGRGNQDDADMLTGIKQDLHTVKDTFALKEVPKESLYIGAAGVLPYAATSLSTVFLASEIKRAHTHSSGYLFSADTAHQLLDWVTPIQIGYGAVIISFLGAVHWGLEYAGYGGYHSYRRYMYGVIAPAVAWPTTFMPVEYALITQFLAFTYLYFADARATVKGWFPPWYSTYRFVLTFFVGASIVISLVGRGQIVSHGAKLKNPADYIKADRDSQWIALENEEKARVKAAAAAEGEDEVAEEEEDKSENADKNREGKDEQKDAKGKNKESSKKDESKHESKGDKKDDKKGKN